MPYSQRSEHESGDRLAGPAVLLADRDSLRVDRLKKQLCSLKCRLVEALPSELHAAFCRYSPELAIVTVCSSDADGVLDQICRLRQRDRRAAILVLALPGSEELAIGALRAGVKDYFREPIVLQDVVASVRRTLAITRPGSVTSASKGLPPLVGDSAAMRELRDRLVRVAGHDATVLITGETGTGKDLVAALLHAASPRQRRRFVAINCAAIPESLLESELFGHERGAFTGAALPHHGLLQQAHGGTMFFDEIGEMSAIAQAKVLRAIEGQEILPLGAHRAVPVDVRIVAATNQDLERSVSEGRFRKDLYFRLNVVRIHLPPLRERVSDIPMLLRHYVDHFAARAGRRLGRFTDDAVTCLQRYAWPGNIRELKNLVEAIFASGPPGHVGVADLPDDFLAKVQQLSETPEKERERLLAVLFETRWNKSRAARQLRCSRMTLYRRLKRLQLTPSDDPHRRRQGGG